MFSIVRFLVVFLFVLFYSVNIFSQAENHLPLEIGKSVERELKGGEFHSYNVKLEAGQFLYVVAEQKGIDVVIAVFAPDGNKVAEIDSPNGNRGEEQLRFISETAGDHRLEIRSLENKSPAGNYQVKIVELRNSTPRDAIIIKAKEVFAEGNKLRAEKENTKENHQKALDNYKEALKLFREADDIVGEARALSSIGFVHEFFLDYETALEFQKQSLKILEKTDDKSSTVLVTRFIAQLNHLLGNYAEAIEVYKQALRQYEILGDKDQIFGVLGNIGLRYEIQGNYFLALKYHLQALETAKEINKKGPVAAAMINIGRVYFSQQNDEIALAYFQNALVIFEEIKAKGGIMVAMNNLGMYHLAQNDYSKALEYFQKTEALRNISLVYLAQGDYKKALEYNQKALQRAGGVKTADENAARHSDMSRIYALGGDYVQAIENAEKAVSFYRQANRLENLWLSLTALGKYYRQTNEEEKAQKAFEEAISVIENLRLFVVGGEQQQQNFLEDKISPYSEMMKVMISKGKLTEALTFAERTKSRTLLDVLQRGKVDVTKAMSIQEQKQEKRLKNELISLNAQIPAENKRQQPDKILLADLQSQLQKKRLEFEDFQTRLYAIHPELRVQRGEMKPITLEESAKLLPDHQSALLEYVVTDDKAFLFVLTREAKQSVVSLKVYPIEIKQKDLAEKTESFRSKLAKGDLDFASQAQDLYNLLLKPTETQLKGKTNLIIVPDNILWDLPFQALQPAQNKYLVETAAVSYAPSLTALREMRKKNQGKQLSGATLLAFGNPTVGRGTSERVKQVFMSERLEPLPEAERLVNSLQKIYGATRSKVFIGAEAREEIAKAESPNYRIVQFAAHGILNDASPMYSHIVLAQKQNNPAEDGLLEAWEMKDLNLNADVVILSACETARGRFGSGEGVIGMSWALFIAGAPTTVASQWKVESSSTTELMLEFHRQLLTGKGISKAEALRRAELKLLKTPQYKHPSYWAGFVIVGDGS